MANKTHLIVGLGARLTLRFISGLKVNRFWDNFPNRNYLSKLGTGPWFMYVNNCLCSGKSVTAIWQFRSAECVCFFKFKNCDQQSLM